MTKKLVSSKGKAIIAHRAPVFIGYVGEADKKIAEICDRRLRTSGFSTILSEESYDNKFVRDKIIRQLKKCDMFFAVHSSRSLDSAWLHQELGFFVGKSNGSVAGIHVLARNPNLVNESRSVALFCNINCLQIPRKSRDKPSSEIRTLDNRNKSTLESALDMVICAMERKGRVTIRTRTDQLFGNHKVLDLLMEFPCCGLQSVEMPIRILHRGWVIRFLVQPSCPRCRERYSLDPLTWEPMPLPPQRKGSRFIDKEFELYRKAVLSSTHAEPEWDGPCDRRTYQESDECGRGHKP